jgi:hypothetical protein
MSKYILRNCFVLFFVSIVIISCGDDQLPTGSTGNTVDTSILRTDEFGNILGGDTTDWCYSNPNTFNFGPAYPNPTMGSTVTVKFRTPVNDSLKLYIIKSSGDSVIFFNKSFNAGVYTFTINDSINQFANTYQRIRISSVSLDPSQYCRFYGDIKFEP